MLEGIATIILIALGSIYLLLNLLLITSLIVGFIRGVASLTHERKEILATLLGIGPLIVLYELCFDVPSIMKAIPTFLSILGTIYNILKYPSIKKYREAKEAEAIRKARADEPTQFKTNIEEYRRSRCRY